MYDGAVEIFKRKQANLANLFPRQELLYFETRDALLEALPSIIKEDDTILVKASNSMGFEIIVKALLE